MSRQPFRLELSSGALRSLGKLSTRDAERVRAAAEALTVRPRPPGSAVLKGQRTRYRRVRVGRFRVVYEVLDDQDVVRVVEVGDRRDVYRAFLV